MTNEQLAEKIAIEQTMTFPATDHAATKGETTRPTSDEGAAQKVGE